MKRKDVSVERAIPLTGQQFRSFRAVFNMNDQVKRLIAGLIEEFMEGQTDREYEMWDQMAQLCGFSDHDELVASGRSIQLDFTARQIKLLKKDD